MFKMKPLWLIRLIWLIVPVDVRSWPFAVLRLGPLPSHGGHDVDATHRREQVLAQTKSALLMLALPMS
jgi:hypothetical protein